MDEIRHLYCKFYPSCLHLHARLEKRFFSCARCRRYSPLHMDPEDIVEEALNVGEFLRALFFEVDPYEVRDEMKRKPSDDEMVLVPARVLRGLMFSFTQGMSYFAGTSNLIQKINDILKQGKPDGQQFSDASGNTAEGEPGTNNYRR